MTPPWTLRAWPPVLWQATSTSKLHFTHLGTRVLTSHDSHQPSTGQTLWGGGRDHGGAGVAWDWIQVMPGIVAMADPMSVITNLRLLGAEGEVLTAWQAARYLNQIVHDLPWQEEVQRVIGNAAPIEAPLGGDSTALREWRATH